jgi:hypothetical protein
VCVQRPVLLVVVLCRRLSALGLDMVVGLLQCGGRLGIDAQRRLNWRWRVRGGRRKRGSSLWRASIHDGGRTERGGGSVGGRGWWWAVGGGESSRRVLGAHVGVGSLGALGRGSEQRDRRGRGQGCLGGLRGVEAARCGHAHGEAGRGGAGRGRGAARGMVRGAVGSGGSVERGRGRGRRRDGGRGRSQHRGSVVEGAARQGSGR